MGVCFLEKILCSFLRDGTTVLRGFQGLPTTYIRDPTRTMLLLGSPEQAVITYTPCSPIWAYWKKPTYKVAMTRQMGCSFKH